MDCSFNLLRGFKDPLDQRWNRFNHDAEARERPVAIGTVSPFASHLVGVDTRRLVAFVVQPGLQAECQGRLSRLLRPYGSGKE